MTNRHTWRLIFSLFPVTSGPNMVVCFAGGGVVLNKKFNKHDEYKQSSHNHRKIPTIYFAPKYRKILAKILLRDLYSDPDTKYITVGCQQRLVPEIWSCLVSMPHQELSDYLTYSGIISVFAETPTPIDSVIIEHFHLPLSTDQTFPLQISPYNLIANMRRSQIDPLPAFLQCEKYPKFGTALGLRLTNLSSNCKNLCT